MMSQQFVNSYGAAAVQAGSVLRAWAASDEAAFRSEISNTLDLCALPASGSEEESRELLAAVASSLRHAPMSSEGAPMVHVCIDLLAHLAAQDSLNVPSVVPLGSRQ